MMVDLLPRKYRVGDARVAADFTPDMKAFHAANVKDRERMIREAFAEERAKFEAKQMDLFAITEQAVIPDTSPKTEEDCHAIMRNILKQYHVAAIAGSCPMQMDAVQRFEDLVAVYSKMFPGFSGSAARQDLFDATEAKDGDDILFGQSFARIVDLGPCRALLEFDGFGTLGLSMRLRAIDRGPFISQTGFRSCGAIFLGWSKTHVHSLEGKTPINYMIELAKSDLDRVKKTGELKVMPWAVPSYGTATQAKELTGKALEVKQWLDSTISPGLPSYVKEVRHVSRGTLPSGFGGHFKYRASIVVFDDQMETVELTPGDGGCMQWHESNHGHFHWDETAKAWVRLPIGWEDADVAAYPCSRYLSGGPHLPGSFT